MPAAVDTSVVVAGLCTWHPDHEVARAVLSAGPVGLAHVLVESFSVLTRLPSSRRLDPAIALAAIRSAFPQTPVGLPPGSIVALLERLVLAGISGGATYDAVVAETARRARLSLYSLDARARATYDSVGVEVLWVA